MRPHLGVIEVPGPDLSGHLPALGWLEPQPAGEQLALPTDLFMLTVRCDDAGLQALADGDSTPLVTLTLLRTRPERFQPAGGGRLAFALLTPLGLMQLLRAPLDGMSDRQIRLSHFCSAGEQRVLRDGLLNAPDAAQRTLFFGAWLERRIRRRGALAAGQARVAEVVLASHGADGPVDLQATRARLAVSQRQLERDFRKWLGVPISGYARLVRFQRTVGGLAGGDRLIDAALLHDFSDQPHMNRGLRQLSAMTPRELVRLAVQPRRVLERRVLAGRLVVVDAPTLQQPKPRFRPFY